MKPLSFVNTADKIYICALLLLLWSCATKQHECDRLGEVVNQQFNVDYFDSIPEFVESDDTLRIELKLRNEHFSKVLISALTAKVNHLVDSLNCYNIHEKLNNGLVRYQVYFGGPGKENLADYRPTLENSLDYWEFPWYRELVNLLLKVDPKEILYFNEMLYRTNGQNVDFQEITLHWFYVSSLSHTEPKYDEIILLDSLYQYSLDYKDYVDPNFVLELKKVFQKIENQNELVIETQPID